MADISEMLFITDLDGTLLPQSKIISEKDFNEISNYRKKGGLFSIATGRTIQSAKPYYKSLDIDIPIILYNGAMIYSPKDDKILYTCTLAHNMKNIVMEILEKFDFAGCEILKSDGVYVVRNNEYEQEHINICKAEPVFCNIDDMECDGWLKVLFAMPSEKTDEVWNFISSLENSADFIRSSDTFIELLPHDVSKGNALKKYSEITGINISYIVSAGDYDNDIEMLEYADLGIAPANACKKALQSADIISEKSCEDNFIADAVKYIFTEVI